MNNKKLSEDYQVRNIKAGKQPYYDLNKKEASKIVLNDYEELINDEDYNFSRYSFFLANHLLFKNKNI